MEAHKSSDGGNFRGSSGGGDSFHGNFPLPPRNRPGKHVRSSEEVASVKVVEAVEVASLGIVTATMESARTSTESSMEPHESLVEAAAVEVVEASTKASSTSTEASMETG